jgi:hypothetical protein
MHYFDPEAVENNSFFCSKDVAISKAQAIEGFRVIDTLYSFMRKCFSFEIFK